MKKNDSMLATAMPAATGDIKDGARHLASLRDGRLVYLEGNEIEDVANHIAFRNAVQSVGALYDYQAQHADSMTFRSPTADARVNLAWMTPTSYEELVTRRKALVEWAQVHCGFMGRSPDHVASALAGQVMGLEVFERHDRQYADNLRDYYQFARDNDLYLTYVIINPQGNRSKEPAHQQEDLVMRVVDEDSQGITVRGAKMLGTGAIMANEVFVAHLQPLRPGEEKYAVCFAVPMNTPGLRILSRKSFEAQAISQFDNPISSRFDENDALLFFDDVKVPKERIFVNQNTDMCRAQFHDTPGHVFQNYQSQLRLLVKLKFLAGVARKVCETIGTIALPPVQSTLGKLASDAAAVEAFVYAMEVAGSMRGPYFIPNRHMLYSAQVFTQELYPTFVNAIRDLAGGSLIMLPSSVHDFGSAKLRRIIELTQSSDTMQPAERVKFLKLAWDVLGSEFASRHQQYEMFYAGAQFVTRGHSFRTYDWAGAKSQVEQILAGYTLDQCLRS